MRRFSTAAISLVLAIGLANCSSSSDSGSDSQDDRSQEIEDVVDDTQDQDTEPAVEVEVEAPTFVLTGPVDPPEGWIEDPSNCAEPEKKGPPFFTYYVPADWDNVGSGSGGSGAIGGSGDHTYAVGDGRIKIEIDEDNYERGEVQYDATNDDWTTWDYESTTVSSAGEVTESITYDELSSVDIDGESVDLYYLDETQNESVSSSEYKTRVVYGEVPAFGFVAPGKERHEASATVTMYWSAEDSDLTEEEASEILSTFRISECAQEGITETYELLFNTEF